MRKPSTAILLWAYWVLWALWALLPTRAAQASDISDLEGRDTLRVLAVISAEETFFVAPSGSPLPGFDVEILEGFAKLHKLKLDVVPVQGWDGLIPALRRHDGDLKIGVFLGRPTSLAYGVRKEDEALLGALNAYVSNLRRTSTWSRLVVKYFGTAAPEILKKARAQ